MCLLIQQPAGCTFSKVELRDFIARNPDGYGYARADHGHMVWGKMVADAETIIADYYQHMAGKAGMLHFRMATHGPTDRANAHPFLVTPEIVLAHNGVLSSGNPFCAAESDTAHFVKYIVQPIALSNPDLLFTPEWGEMIGDLIGRSNKLTIQHANGRAVIINSEGGVLHKGAWMSNTYAWSNPANVSRIADYDPDENYFSYGGYRGYSDHRSSTTTTSDTPAIPSSYADTSMYEDTVVSCARHYQRNGLKGIADWMRANPQDAANVLFEHYGLSEEDAQDLVTDSSDQAVSYLEVALNQSGILADIEYDEDPYTDANQYAFA